MSETIALAEIERLYSSWAEAFRRGDVDAVFDLLTPDYKLWSAAPEPMGRDAMRPMLAKAFETYELVPSFEREEQLVSGDLAVDVGWDVQTVRPRDGGPERTQRQRVCLVLRRGGDGVWRFARGMTQPAR